LIKGPRRVPSIGLFWGSLKKVCSPKLYNREGRRDIFGCWNLDQPGFRGFCKGGNRSIEISETRGMESIVWQEGCNWERGFGSWESLLS